MAWKETEKLFKHIIWESKQREQGKEFDYPELTTIDRLVWLILAFHKNHLTGQCNPSWEVIMSEAKISRGALAESLGRLREYRLTSDPRKGRSNWYSWEELPDHEQETLEELRKEFLSPNTSTGDVLDQYASRTTTSTSDVLDQYGSRTPAVRETYPNRGINRGSEDGKKKPGNETSRTSHPKDDKPTGGNPLYPHTGDTPVPPQGSAPAPPVMFSQEAGLLLSVWNRHAHVRRLKAGNEADLRFLLHEFSEIDDGPCPDIEMERMLEPWLAGEYEVKGVDIKSTADLVINLKEFTLAYKDWVDVEEF
jgi:hypothetical protein